MTRPAPERRSVNDAARHRIAAAEHERGFDEVARKERLADARGTHAGVRVKERRCDVELVVKFFGKRLEEFDVAVTVGAEVKVLPHGDPVRVKPFAENVANEGFGPKRGEVLVEGENVDALDARFENAQHLVVEGGDAREDFVGLVKEFSGMRLERHAGGLEAPVGRGLHERGEGRPQKTRMNVRLEEKRKNVRRLYHGPLRL